MDFHPNPGRTPGGDIIRGTLGQIPTIFGRLVYLASLRNLDDGHYEHEQLARVYGAEGADQLLRHHHRQIFSEWLEQSLEDQKGDLTEYLAGVQRGIGHVGNLEEVAAYRTFIPSSAREVERQLYLTDLETLIELLRHDPVAATWG